MFDKMGMIMLVYMIGKDLEYRICTTFRPEEEQNSQHALFYLSSLYFYRVDCERAC
jgi:hypothetical protein